MQHTCTNMHTDMSATGGRLCIAELTLLWHSTELCLCELITFLWPHPFTLLSRHRSSLWIFRHCSTRSSHTTYHHMYMLNMNTTTCTCWIPSHVHAKHEYHHMYMLNMNNTMCMW